MAEKKKPKKPKASKKPVEPKELDHENRDFGGFPDRDLKKNLGCG